MIYLCNAWSLNMLHYMPCGAGCRTQIRHISAFEAGELLRENPFVSFFGHNWTAFHLARYLQAEIPVNRGKLKLEEGDILLVASAGKSSRDPESGARKLPKWRFYTVTLCPAENSDQRADDGTEEEAAGTPSTAEEKE